LNLYCVWDVPSIDGTQETNVALTLNYSTTDKYTLVVGFSYGSVLYTDLMASKSFETNQISSLTLHYFSGVVKSYSPFSFMFKYDAAVNTSGNTLVIYLILLIASICGFLLIGVCVYTCIKSFCDRILRQQENINHQFQEVNMQMTINNANNNINKLFENELKPFNYILDKVSNEYECTGCTICLEGFTTDQEVVKLLCKHLFHFKCFQDLLIRNPKISKCPNCNFPICKTCKADDEHGQLTRGDNMLMSPQVVIQVPQDL